VTALGALGSRLESLRALGAHVDYADPRVPQITVGGHRLEAVAWEQADLGAYDLMLRLTAHAEFDPKRLVSDAWLVVDTRYATGALGEFPHVVRL
jgi:UDP-N-acetyl-D-glucosamine dehydrogenase